MCAKWRDNVAPSAIIEALRAYEKPKPKGGRRFEGGMGGELDFGLTAIESYIDFHGEVPSRERHTMATRALFDAKALTPNAVISEVSRSERAFLSRKRKPLLLYTTLSLSRPRSLKRRDVANVRLTFGSPLAPDVVADLNKKAEGLVSHTIPTNYLPVRAHVKARSVDEAYELGQNAIDFVRGVWNLCWNIGTQGFRISGGRPAPVNKILLGPIRSVHHTSGKSADDKFWYNPGYYGAMQLASLNTRQWRAVRAFEQNVRAAIKRSPESDRLKVFVIRYVQSLDEEILENAFLKLWALLETMTSQPRDSYDVTIRRTSRLFKNHGLHREVLQNFRDLRNATVHQFKSPESVESVLFQLKYYVETMLRNLIGSAVPVVEFWDLLDLPTDVGKLEYRLGLTKKALRMRKR